jgi:hypothetical protein
MTTEPKYGEWLPIESAPKDNKRPLMLARFNEAGQLTQFDYNAIWESESESWEIPQVYYYWASENGNVEEPTHWMYQPDWFAVAAPQPAPAPVQVDDSRSWPEDAQHENGDYECECVTCGRHFIGHKRRHVCKACAHPPAPAADGAVELGHIYTLIDEVKSWDSHEPWHYCEMRWSPDGQWLDRRHVLERLEEVRAAIASLRQPVPDAVRELPGKWRDQTAFGHPEAMSTFRICARDLESAIASQQESRNASDWVYKIAAAITEQQESRNAD